MKLSVFGRHPVPQGGFNGVMSIFECVEFSKLGYDTTLLLPFVDQAAYYAFLGKHRLDSLDALSRFGGSFAIKPVFPNGENFEPCDVLVYQSYFPEDWTLFSGLCRQVARVLTKNYPKFVIGPEAAYTNGVVGQFKQVDLVACALQEDVDALNANTSFAREYAGRYFYAPRGACPDMLHPGYKAGLPPTIGLDVPNVPDMAGIQHYFEPIERLRRDYPDLRIVSIGRDLPIEGAVKIPFGRFDAVYENFFNRIHAYCVINYEHSPSHLQAEVSRVAPAWRRKAIYEVQNIEAQMSGATLIGHRDNVISELYEPGVTGLNYTDFTDGESIYATLKTALDHRLTYAAACRRFAVENFAWRRCIRLWSDGIQAYLQGQGASAAALTGGAPAAAPSTIAAPAVATPAAAPSPPPPPPPLLTAKPLPPTRDEEVNHLIRLGQKFKWAQGEERGRLEANGVNLVRTDFYSDTPTLAEIEASFEYENCTGPADAPAAFDDPVIFDHDAIVAYATALVPHTVDFAPQDGEDASGYQWKNSQFSGTDAMLLYGMIRARRPRTVIEIGSGFSTHLMHQALADAGGGRLICIDPEPRTAIADLSGIEFLRQPIQSVDRDYFLAQLQPGDIVFYDGSHTVKTGSDTVYFYLKLLPYLPAGVIVHAHDVRLPYPRNKRALLDAKLYWGEPYLLMTHLHNTTRYRVLVGSEFLTRRAPEVSKSLMHGRWAAGGVSMWYEILG